MFGIWDIEAKRVLAVDEIKKLNLHINCVGDVVQLFQEPMAIVMEFGIIDHNKNPPLYKMENVSCRYKPLWKVGCG